MTNKISKAGKQASAMVKILVIVSVTVGVWLTAASGRDTFMGGNRVFMYFTIQSNILIGLISLIGLVYLGRNLQAPRAWYVIKLSGTVAITLTGLVFCFVLVPVLGPGFWNFQNVLTHVVVPVLAVADFFITGPVGEIKTRDVLYVTVPPLLYAVYAAIGYISGWEFSKGVNYPYFFLNWGSPAGVFGFTEGLPFMGTGWWIIAILVLLLLLGWGYLSIVRLIGRRTNKTEHAKP